MCLTLLVLWTFGSASEPAVAKDLNPFQGVDSLNPKELERLVQLSQSEVGAKKVTEKLIRDAGKILDLPPNPSGSIVTSGDAVRMQETSNSSIANEQSKAAYTLALAYVVSGNQDFFDQANRYLKAWSETYRSNGDSVAASKLVSMARAYDLLYDKLKAEDREQVGEWLESIGTAVLDDQEKARRSHAVRGINNHRSHALLVLAAVGCATDNKVFLAYVVDKSFKEHVAVNLGGTADDLGLDFQERKAIHYVAYNLQALTQLAVILDRAKRIPGNPAHISFEAFSYEANNGSILKTFRSFLPYAAGEKQSNDEFRGSQNINDEERVENGSLKETFQRRDAMPALEYANYFGAGSRETMDVLMTLRKLHRK